MSRIMIAFAFGVTVIAGCARRDEPQLFKGRMNTIKQTPPAGPGEIAGLRFRWDAPPLTDEEFRKNEGKEPPPIIWVHTHNRYCRYHEGKLIWWYADAFKWVPDGPTGSGEAK